MKPLKSFVADTFIKSASVPAQARAGRHNTAKGGNMTVIRIASLGERVNVRLKAVMLAWLLAPWSWVGASEAADLRSFFLGKAKGSGFGGDPILLWPDEGPGTPRPRSVNRQNGVEISRSNVMNVRYSYFVQGGLSPMPETSQDGHLLSVEGYSPLYNAALPWVKPAPGLITAVDRAALGVSDRFELLAPMRRNAMDGAEYEAVPLRVDRSGVGELVTLYFGYRMGQVAGKTGPSVPSSQAEDYELAALPPPFVEGEVVEYVYRPSIAASPWGHFFYATSEADKALLDGNADWMRTGRAFKSGGYLPVCRFFYRPPSGGAATHFYTARADECERFKTQPGFSYEGIAFRASLPRPQQAGQAADDPARCPEKTVPLWRYFNAPASTSVAPNHRYVLNRNVGQAMASGSAAIRPWAAEGIALCVPE
jgi:hypothetical protein